jgi:hypothetical protein
VTLGYGGSRVADSLDPGSNDWRAYALNSEIESPFGLRGALLALDARSITYGHPAQSSIIVPCPAGSDSGCITQNNGAQTYRTGFNVRDISYEARLGMTLLERGPVLDVGYTTSTTNSGRPAVGGVGFGLEVPPNLDLLAAGYGSIMYYPTFFGTGYHYVDLRYRVGVTLSPYGALHQRNFIDIAFLGDRRIAQPGTAATAQLQEIIVAIGRRF